MHRALQFDDIIYSVLEFVRSSMDLVNVAVTCSRLADPALNIIWSKQSSLAPLIMCLPQDTWEVGADQTINLSREPTPSEWECLRMNASRVRRLLSYSVNHTHPPGPHVSGHVLQRLFEQFHPTTLFPNLYALDFVAVCWPLESSSKIVLLRKFMSPGLEELLFDLRGGIPTHEAEQLLSALPTEAHGLRKLSVSADYGITALTVPPSFGRLQKLIDLTIHGIDVCLTRQTITNIQQARCLQTLMLGLSGTSCDAGAMALELRSLQHLYLFSNSLPQCTHFLRQLTTQQLSHINIWYPEPASPLDITVFMESLTMLCRTIGYLEHINMINAKRSGDNELPLPSEIFRPLFNFNRLRTAKFINIGTYNLDDRFINDIAVAWPGIRVLEFASKRRASCNVTFIAMMSLASRCRSLQALHLTFDATQPTTIPQAQDGTEELWPTQTALCNLHLGYSEVSEVARVPYILADVFPNLSDFNWYDNFEDSEMQSALEDAWQQLKVLRNLTADNDGDDGNDPDDEL